MRKSTAICAVLALATLPALAGSVAVTNYNWMQLPLDQTSALIGSTSGVGGAGYASPDDYRVGGYVFIPSGALTADGSATWWAAIKFDQARNVQKVGVQWWAAEGTGVKKYYIDGSLDGAEWTNMGSYDFGSMQSNAKWFGLFGANNSLTLTNPGTYQYVRVRLEPGDYTYGSAARGGPGIFEISATGDGTVAEDKVNWLNSQFGTTVTTNGLAFPNNRLNDGYVYDDEAIRTGDAGAGPGGAWAPDQYIQMNLGTARTINKLVGIWDYNWNATDFDIQYSTDGTNFLPVAGKSAPLNQFSQGCTTISFNPVKAQYFRIVNASGGGPYELFNQVFMYGPVATVPGDANRDSKVDFADYLILESSYGSAPSGPDADADFDDNNVVEFADYLVLEANFGTGAVPEPMTLSLLALGGLALLRRR